MMKHNYEIVHSTGLGYCKTIAVLSIRKIKELLGFKGDFSLFIKNFILNNKE